MPLVEFECEHCKSVFETLVRHGEEPRCPECGSTALKKRISRFCARSASCGSSRSIGGKSCSTCSSGNCSSCS